METVYQRLEIENIENAQSNYLSQSFSWLNMLIFYLPMWSQQNADLKPRSRCFSWLVLVIIIISIFYHLVFVIFFYIYLALTGFMYQIVFASSEIIISTSRLFSVYYFYRQFNYPWINRKQQQLQPLTSNHVKIIKKNKIIILSLLILIMILDTTMAVLYVYSDAQSHKTFYVAADIVGRIFIFFPMFITFTVAAVIFVKYHLCLLQLCDRLQYEVNFDEMLKNYVKIQETFKSEYSSCLEWSILLYLFGIVLDLWVASYEILLFNSWSDVVDIAEEIFLFILFVMSASLIGESFAQYEKVLYRYGMDKTKQDVNYNEYHYMLAYVSRYPIRINLGRVTITKVNAIKFVAVFSVAKLMAYSVHYIAG